MIPRRDDDGVYYELIDGQQRLTTIALILNALKSRWDGTPYALTYRTRPELTGFLAAPSFDRRDERIDFHHVWEAHDAITTWFDKAVRWTDVNVLRCLTGETDFDANVRVIWYELDDSVQPNDVFIRLNTGRIALTSAELIRGLLLMRRDGDGAADARLSPRQERTARDWDQVARRLRQPAFWFFVFLGAKEPTTRIEYLFDVFLRAQPGEHLDALEDDELRVFLGLNAWLDGAPGRRPLDAWSKVYDMVERLEDWYADRTLYHLVGLLIARDTRPAEVLVTLLEGRKPRGAEDFDRWLRGLVLTRLRGQGITRKPPGDIRLSAAALSEEIRELVDSLTYTSSSGERIRTALLLFNVAGLLAIRGTARRFQFAAWQQRPDGQRQRWDIEHVRSVTEAMPGDPRGRKAWAREARRFIDTELAELRVAALPADRGLDLASLRSDLDAIDSDAAPTDERFRSVFDRVRVLSGEADARDGDDNALSNLVLLDAATNRSYKNAVFPVKRRTIIARDHDGTFVLPATRDVFLKYYSPEAADVWLWGQQDEARYRDALIRTLEGFFAPLVTEAP